MRFIEKVLEHAKTVPDKPAVYTPAGMITYMLTLHTSYTKVLF